MHMLPGRITHIRCILTSPSRVFSILPLTTLANSGSVFLSSWAVMMGVLIVLEALMISLILGTPKVICDEENQAKGLYKAHHLLSHLHGTVEPLYKGYHWDIRNYPLYTGVLNSEVKLCSNVLHVEWEQGGSLIQRFHCVPVFMSLCTGRYASMHKVHGGLSTYRP